MTGPEIRAARATLGEMWGLNRPLRASELGRALLLMARDPGRTVLDWERGKTPVSGQASLVIETMLAGFVPNGLYERLATSKWSVTKIDVDELS